MNTTIELISQLISQIAQVFAMIIILVGIIKALFIYGRNSFIKLATIKTIKLIRLELGVSFSLGLGFLIGSSIVKTVYAPSWDDIGKLTAIIAIRTVLNYFLTRDIISE